MAEQGPQGRYSFRAAADLTTKQWHIMRVVAAGPPPTCNIASNALAAANVGMVGVLQNAPNTDEPATVANDGLSKVVAGAATSAWAWITTDASGRAINASSGDVAIGRATESAGAAGQVISVLLQKPFKILGT